MEKGLHHAYPAAVRVLLSKSTQHADMDTGHHGVILTGVFVLVAKFNLRMIDEQTKTATAGALFKCATNTRGL